MDRSYHHGSDRSCGVTGNMADQRIIMETLSEKFRHEILNATASIASIIRPYWKDKSIDDQHWALVLAELRQIENACKSYSGGGDKHEAHHIIPGSAAT